MASLVDSQRVRRARVSAAKACSPGSIAIFEARVVQMIPGLRGLRLYVEKKNQPAQKVYRKLGMSDEHYHLFEWMKTF